MMSTTPVPTPMEEPVLVSAARLRELEAAAAALPVVAAKLNRRNNNNIERLTAWDKAHPAEKMERRKRYIDKHRDELNLKQREYRQRIKEKKRAEAEAAVAAGDPPGSDDSAAVDTSN